MASGDRVLCPWCGAKMRVYIDEQGVFDYNAWTECTNNKCTADGPLVTGYETSEEAEEAARAAALRRYTTPITAENKLVCPINGAPCSECKPGSPCGVEVINDA